MDYTFPDGALIELTAMSDTGHSFVEWSGDAVGNQNPMQIIMDAGKNIVALFTEDIIDPPPNTDRILTVSVIGQGNVMVNDITAPPPPPPPPGNFDWTVPGTYSDISSVPFGSLSGTNGKISGTYQGGREIDGANNITITFENFVLENGSDRGLNLDNSNNLTLKAFGGDYNNFKIRNFGGKHLRGERLNNLVVDGVFCETGNSGGQTDTVYLQRTTGITIRNSKFVINNEDISGHNDIIQMYLCGGNVLIENIIGLQNNSKTTNNQGIYATTPLSTGNYKYLNNFISGTQKNGQLSLVKNCLVLKRTGGSNVPIEIRGNKVRSDGYKFIWLNEITNYNSDIRTVNDVDPSQIIIN